MQLLSAFAIFFIIWWTVLFTVLPFGVRSQVESKDTVLGTERGAPSDSRIKFKLMITTLIAIIIFAAFYYLSIVRGFGMDDLPQFVPNFADK
jgi:predicted secreted protein